MLRGRLKELKLQDYKPYPKQQSFHNAGSLFRERLLRAGNQQGKTYSGAAECATHATGLYPAWWQGKKWERSTAGWAGGVTGEVVRDTIQRLLIGGIGEQGTGLIPKTHLVDIIPSRGVAGLADTIVVKNEFGGQSRIRLKYFEQGREKWQSDTLDWIWFDEEPPIDIYMEGLTRTNATNGITWMTFTPLLGMSDTVRRFLTEESRDRIDVNMTIEDAEHIPAEERQKIIDSYPLHERSARLNGTPILGSGRIFPVAEEEITCKPFTTADKPFFWMEIAGIDFGWDHPTAAAKLLYDPQDDVIYVTNVYKRKEATPIIHSASLRSWGNVFWAWPHDGLQHDKGSGEQLKQIYYNQGLNMLPENAKFTDGSNGVEAGLAEMLMRMETGKFKVFSHLTEFFEEFRLYHRKDGKIVKEYDDAICAVRYAMMCLRFATPLRKSKTSQNGQHSSRYDPLDREYVSHDLGANRATSNHKSSYDSLSLDYIRGNG